MCRVCTVLYLRAQALDKDDKALLVNVDKMAYANLYVTDGDLHVQAVDTLPTPNPRGVFDSQRTNMIGNARAVPYVDEFVTMQSLLCQHSAAALNCASASIHGIAQSDYVDDLPICSA